MKVLEQISLFTTDEVTQDSYLYIVHNGQVKDMSLQELFDVKDLKRFEQFHLWHRQKSFFD